MPPGRRVFNLLDRLEERLGQAGAWRKRADRLADENERLRRVHQPAVAEVVALQQRQETLLLSLATLEEKNREMEERAAEAGRWVIRYRQLEQRERQAREENGRLAAQVSLLEQRNRTLEEGETGLMESRAALEQVTRENRELKDTLVRQQGDSRKLTRIKEDLEQRLQRYRDENLALQRRLEDQRREIDKASREPQDGLTPHKRAVPAEEPCQDDWYCEEGEERGLDLNSELGRARQILGLVGEPNRERIKKALRRRIRKYHPDLVGGLGQEIVKVAHQKAADINRAYGVLMRVYGRE
ncbi:MAG: hypothetical protein HQL82_12020 [Magnetococcales bacterium]|nr:hypothetical protein [Magnetococcales bacterium]